MVVMAWRSALSRKLPRPHTTGEAWEVSKDIPEPLDTLKWLGSQGIWLPT